jgi:pectate lyase
MKKLFVLLIFSYLSFFAFSSIPAFPSAEGFGSVATGGRGGRVIEVTNLSDDLNGTTPGSFRWALKQYPDEPATIVFRVGGVINLVNNTNGLRSSRTKGTTIAGQTAPGEGITIRGAKCNFGGSVNLVVRNVRFRIGLGGDTAFLTGGSVGIENAGRFIFDHCDFGWSGEENMTMYDDTMATVQWSILHEGLYACGHSKGARSYGSQWGGQKVTFHHNLFAHNYNRSPRFNGARSNDKNVLIDYVNNVNYNWGKENSCYGSDLVEGKTNRTNMVNNYYKPGPLRPGTNSSYFTQASFNSGQVVTQIAQFYMNGNYMEGTANSSKITDNYIGLDASAYVAKGVAKTALISSAPFSIDYPVTTETAADAYNSVLAKAGVFPRDTTDRRIIKEVISGTASGKGTTEKYLNSDGTTYSTNGFYGVVKGLIDNPVASFGKEIAYPSATYTTTVVDNDHDGMDDAWELSKGLDPTNPEDRNTLASSGYTALEVYLDSLMGEDIPFGSTDIEKNSTFGIGIYPNPTTDMLNIISPEKICSYSVTDISGKCISVANGSEIRTVDVGKLYHGIYLLALQTESGKKINLKFTK